MAATFRPEDRAELVQESAQALSRQARLMQRAQAAHMERMLRDHGERTQASLTEWQDIAGSAMSVDVAKEWTDYLRDAGDRMVLMLEAFKARADNDAEHEQAGTPPVLIYDHELVMDGADMPQPCNYKLLKITPPAGTTVDDNKRPFIIIDPRAGHGAGIGGFKSDSQVGVALKAQHPVYFVVFGPHPEKGQTLTDVMRAEAAFVREVHRRHPKSDAPIIVGNCQGGWAALLLAAANPDLTGPVVLNGAPVSTWSGRVGENPMRYNGGLLGGILPAMLLADLNNGELDGAHLVSNFEMLDPSRNYIGKYYDLWRSIDTGRERFLEFERWWGGYHFLAEEEIRWIVEQLFVGNRLARNEARIERGRVVDVKQIRSPIVVFASHGDNITPPQQALNWIIDTYADEREIAVRGQRIVYIVHDKVGHLGIFVSASVARREHNEITSTMRTIETLSPGLYEMVVEEVRGEGFDTCFDVSFAERTMADLEALDDGRREEVPPFAAVARLSELGAELYELTARPVVQAMVTPEFARATQALHPGRFTRAIFGSHNPMMGGVDALAEKVRAQRVPADESNIFRRAEALGVGMTMQAIDLWSNVRDMMVEQAFFGLWGSPWAAWAGASHAFERTRKDPQMLRFLPEVQMVLARLEQGGYAEALVRVMLLIADKRGSVRRDRLERADYVLEETEPFRSMGSERVALIIHEQKLIIEFEPERAVETLPQLLPVMADRRRLLDTVLHVTGNLETLDPVVEQALRHAAVILGIPLSDDGTMPGGNGTPPAASITQAEKVERDASSAVAAPMPLPVRRSPRTRPTGKGAS